MPLSVMWLSEEVEAVAHADEARRADRNGGQQHHALEQGLPERLDVEDEQQIADRAERERAENRADRAARTAEQRDAAEHDRRDGIERVGSSVRRRGFARWVRKVRNSPPIPASRPASV